METNHSDTGELARRTAREFEEFKTTYRRVMAALLTIAIASFGAFVWNRTTLVELVKDVSYAAKQKADIDDLDRRVRALETNNGRR